MRKYAEQWWLNKGQYYDPDTALYPKIPIIDAFMAGCLAGRVIGKNERPQTCPNCGAVFVSAILSEKDKLDLCTCDAPYISEKSYCTKCGKDMRET